MGKYDAQRKWKAQHKITIRFDLYENNKAMAAWLMHQESMAGYIKGLIQRDMDAREIEVAAAAADLDRVQDEEG